VTIPSKARLQIFCSRTIRRTLQHSIALQAKETITADASLLIARPPLPAVRWFVPARPLLLLLTHLAAHTPMMPVSSRGGGVTLAPVARQAGKKQREAECYCIRFCHNRFCLHFDAG
jgi:hypothetical protein